MTLLTYSVVRRQEHERVYALRRRQPTSLEPPPCGRRIRDRLVSESDALGELAACFYVDRDLDS